MQKCKLRIDGGRLMMQKAAARPPRSFFMAAYIIRLFLKVGIAAVFAIKGPDIVIRGVDMAYTDSVSFINFFTIVFGVFLTACSLNLITKEF
jgi:hypothetical protein